MAQEYWKWPETVWMSDGIDWRKAKTITAGVDIGTTSSQAAVFCDAALFAHTNAVTGADFRKTAGDVLEKALGNSGLGVKDIDAIAATGFGAKNVGYATKMIDEVQCHAKGARFIFGPTVKTVVDLGGQTTKAISLYDWDRVRDFMMNDKCATGFGRNIELMAELLQVPITEIGEKSLDVESDPEPVSTTCYSFANPETIGLFRTGYREEKSSENEVIAAYIFAIAWRILGVIGKLAPLDVGDLSVEAEIAFTGGLAKNKGITRRIERQLKLTAADSDVDPQLAGAIGAALLAC
jgi:predicted CoA-substrate-specific enzyme activase